VGNEAAVRPLWVYPGPLTPTVAVVLVALSVGLLSVGVLRGETRFHVDGARRSALSGLALTAFVVAGVAVVLALT
jgi:hypothetical protein